MRVDLILADRRFYTFENYAATQVKRVFEQLKIPFRTIYLAEGGLREYLSLLPEDHPSWSLGFSLLTPHQAPLCDLCAVPHFQWVGNAIAESLHYLSSSYGKVGLHDPILYDRLASSHSNIHHLPLGVDVTLSAAEKSFDTVLFGDLVDLDVLRKTWQEVLSKEERIKVERAIVAKDPFLAEERFFYAEQYLKAMEIQALVYNLEGTFKIDIFGEHMGNNWLRRLPSHIHLHAPLPYIEQLEVLRASHFALLRPQDSLFLPSVVARCLPVTHLSSDLRQKREELLELLKEKAQETTWNVQVKKLVSYMENL